MPEAGTQVVELPLASVRPDPEQHRQVFPDEYIQGLAESILAQGQLTPVKVRPDAEPGRYVVIDGECRYRACVLAALPTIRAEVHADLSESQIANMQGAANLARRDVEPCAAGRALRRSIDALKAEKPWLSEDEARKLVQETYGVSGQFAIPRLKLLGLPAEVQALVDKGSVGIDGALALLPLVEKGDEVQAVRFALQVQSGRLRPSDVSSAVAAYLGEQAQCSLFGADAGKATKEERATRDALTRAVWNWERGVSLVFGQERQEGFDLAQLRADELATHEASVRGFVKTLRTVLADLLVAQGKPPEEAATTLVTQPGPVVHEAEPPRQPVRQAPASVLGLQAARSFSERTELPGNLVVRVSGPERWVWVHGLTEDCERGRELQRAGAVWTRSRGGAWYAPGGDRTERVLAALALWDNTAAQEAAG